MDKYTAIIVDDEPLAISLLSKSIEELTPLVKIEKTFTSWHSALEDLLQFNYDILFLDVSIQQRNGIDLVKMIPDYKSEVIFVTAYSEFALNAINVSAAGYLLKPFDDIELGLVINKTIHRIKQKRILEGIQAKSGTGNEKIAIPNGQIINYVSLDDIIYLEGVKAYTRIVIQGSELLCSYSIGKFKDVLPEKSFFQTHRSYIINVNRIKSYDTSGIVSMENNDKVPISNSNRETFLTLFAKIHK